MILEYSGRYLALIEWAAAVRLAVTSSFLLILGLILLWRLGVTAYVTAFTWQSIVLAAVTVTVATGRCPIPRRCNHPDWEANCARYERMNGGDIDHQREGLNWLVHAGLPPRR